MAIRRLPLSRSMSYAFGSPTLLPALLRSNGFSSRPRAFPRPSKHSLSSTTTVRVGPSRSSSKPSKRDVPSSSQLQDYESLVNALAVFAPIAYRLLLIRSEARRTPEASAAPLVSSDEIDVLRALGRRPLGPAPSTRDVYLAIAALGGHIKYSGDPGWLTLSRGYDRLATLTEGWVAAKV